MRYFLILLAIGLARESYSQSASNDAQGGIVFTHKLSSITSEYVREEVQYNERGQVGIVSNYYPNGSLDQKIYTYAASGLLILQQDIDCYPCVEKWKYEYFYDLNDILIREIRTDNNNTDITDYRRDANGNITLESVRSTRITDSDTLEFFTRIINEYDEQGRISKKIYSKTILNEGWVNSQVIDYIYTDSTIEETYHDVVNDNKRKQINTYHSSSHVIPVKYQTLYLESGSADWVEHFRTEIEVDKDLRRKTYLSYRLDEISNELVFDRLSTYAYDRIGNLTSITYFTYNTSTNEWLSARKEVWSYDHNISFYKTAGMQHFIWNLPFITQITPPIHVPVSKRQYSWSEIENTWRELPSTSFNYQPFSPENLGIGYIYPNPVSDYLTFDLIGVNEVTFQLYDSKGNKVIDALIDTTKPISTYDLKKGIYFYRIEGEEQIKSGRLIKN